MKTMKYFSLYLNRFVTVVMILFSGILAAQTNDDCLMCHGDKDLSMQRKGKKVSLFIRPEAILRSVHSTVECVKCHIEPDGENFPHADNVQKMPVVDCGSCNKESDSLFVRGIH